MPDAIMGYAGYLSGPHIGSLGVLIQIAPSLAAPARHPIGCCREWEIV